MDSMEVPLLIIIVPPPEDSESVVTVRDGKMKVVERNKRGHLFVLQRIILPLLAQMFSFHAYTIPKHTSAVRLDQQMQLDSEIACLEKTLNNTKMNMCPDT
uniref:Uncharacterized protein n=1 Tax=Cacopsylla melanoneura TaxID=428564 RepID=A0A8D9BIA7_9HEMI